jgi:hypothetical protein
MLRVLGGNVEWLGIERSRCAAYIYCLFYFLIALLNSKLSLASLSKFGQKRHFKYS